MSESNDSDNDSDNELDNEWINEFKKNEELYNDFYKEKVEQIKLFFLYTSSTNVLETIKKDSIVLDKDGILRKDIIISLIKNHQRYNSIKYRLLSLVRFNIDIEPDEINKFVYNDDAIEHDPSRFITSEKYLNDIKYSNTISIFQDLNSLYFIFYEEKTKVNINLNIHPTINPTTINPTNNNTRKVSMTTFKNTKKYKKTRRVRLL